MFGRSCLTTTATMGHVPSRAAGDVSVLLMAIMAAMIFLSAPASADTWAIDRDHTDVTVAWNHLGVSTQTAQFSRAYGTLSFSPTNPEAGRVEVTIPVAGLLTGRPKFDAHLKSSEFFDAERFPYIRFKSTNAIKVGEKTGLVTGDLTIRDVTQTVTLNVKWNFTGEHPLAAVNPVYEGRWVSGFTATTHVNRSVFGLGRGAPLVSDKVLITINAEFLRRT